MQRRKFSREFKLEAVKLVSDRGVSMAQAARDLDLQINVLRKYVSDHGADPGGAFPGHSVAPTAAATMSQTRSFALASKPVPLRPPMRS
jgi:transposase-like protein